MSAVKNATPLTNWLFYMADSNLILSQKNSEWCGHGPVLEQDIALTNIALDQLGQARAYYQYIAHIINQQNDDTNKHTHEDELAFLRDNRDFRNLLICELPNGDWAQTILKVFLFGHYQYLVLNELTNHPDENIKAIALKSLKEVTYHVRWSGEWVVRLGDGTTESKTRMENAIHYLLPYLSELFNPADFELSLRPYDIDTLKEKYITAVEEVFETATLNIPIRSEIDTIQQKGGKQGLHTEHLGFILAEMQFMQRTYPNMEW